MEALIQRLSILALTSLPLFTLADVNMKDGSYISRRYDLEASVAISAFLNPVYSSRSLHNGLFGYGWCSGIEKRLRQETLQKLVLSDCERGPSEFTRASTQELTYISKFNTQSQIVRDNTGFTWVRTDGARFRFDLSGELVQIDPPNQGPIRITRSLARLHMFWKNWGIEIKTEAPLARATRAEVHRIANSKKVRVQSLSYHYLGYDLIAVESEGQKTSYTYGSGHNMIHVAHPDNTQEQISYDETSDRVLKIVDRKKCQESYVFDTPPRRPAQASSIIETAVAKQSCPDGPLRIVHYEFTYLPLKDSSHYLANVSIRNGKSHIQVKYAPETNSP